MRLLLIRHGETALNVARVLQPADTPLSDRGLAQAQALGRRLARWSLEQTVEQTAGQTTGQTTDQPGQPDGPPPAGVLCSDLPRALATAQAIARACGLGPPHTTPLLQERNFGDLRGRAYDSLGFDPLAAPQAPPGGESMAQFRARCDQAWDEALRWQQRLGGPLAVVTHGLVLRVWLDSGRLLPAPGAGHTGWPAHLANTGLTVVQATPPHQVLRLNCTAHLAGEGGPPLAAGSLSGG